MNYLIFNNKNSYSDLGLVFKESISIPISNENVREVKVEGRSGTLTEKLGTYDDKHIEVNFTSIPNSNLYSTISELILWSNKIINNKLYFHWNLTEYYLVKYVVTDNIKTNLNLYGEFKVTFVCEPFKYGNEIIRTISTNNFSFDYLGSIEAEPVIKVYGSGNITLTINTKNVILTGVNSYITIDSKLKDCYKDTTLTNSQMSGEFPLIKPGSNIISWIGTVGKIEVSYNETYL